MTNDQLFVAGLALGAIGMTVAIGLLLEVDGVWRRHRASRRRAADRGMVNLR